MWSALDSSPLLHAFHVEFTRPCLSLLLLADQQQVCFLSKMNNVAIVQRISWIFSVVVFVGRAWLVPSSSGSLL